MNQQNCEEWLQQPSINPKTKRRIKIGGPVYKQLEKECEEDSSPLNPCEEWLQRPSINPKTKRSIKIGGPVYKRLEKECSGSPQPHPVLKASLNVCEEWLQQPSVNPKTKRSIKIGGPVYKQLEKECDEPVLPDSSSSDENEPTTTCRNDNIIIQVSSIPKHAIKDKKFNLVVYGDNNMRFSSNENHYALKHTKQAPKTNEKYFKVGDKIYRNHNIQLIDIFNPMIKYIPNFVYVFKNNTTEPYIDIDYNNFKLSRALFFDLCLIQALINMYPYNIRVKPELNLCLLKCDKVVLDLISKNRTKYYRDESEYRLCLTPDSFYINNSVESPREEKNFLSSLLHHIQFEDWIDGDLTIKKLIEKVKKTNTVLAHDNTYIKELMKKLSKNTINGHIKINNNFHFPLLIEPNILYFNVSTNKELFKDRYVKRFLEEAENNDMLELFNGRIYSLPFNILFHPNLNFDGKEMNISNVFITGPYMVKYNKHKIFYPKSVIFNEIYSEIDPYFFTMLRTSSTSSSETSMSYSTEEEYDYVFKDCNITNMSNITMTGKNVLVSGNNPEYIFKCTTTTLKKLTFKTSLNEDGQNHINLQELPQFCNKVDNDLAVEIFDFDVITFPDSFMEIGYNLTILFNDCNITSFHPSLFTSDKLYLDFYGCNLSENSIVSLRENINSVPFNQRPHINYNLALLRRPTTQHQDLPIAVVLEKLFDNNVKLDNVTCDGPLTSWLNRVYKDSSTTIISQLLPHILDMLKEMDHNSEFMEEACNIIQDATATCGDRMILSVLYVSLQFKMHLLANSLDKTEDIVNFLIRGPFIMGELEKIAREKIKTMRVVDEIEVYLAYPIKLRDYYNIPIETREMLYYTCSSIDNKDLERAKQIVDKKLHNKDIIINFLSTQPLWTKVIYSIDSDIFDDLNTLHDNIVNKTRQILNNYNF